MLAKECWCFEKQNLVHIFGKVNIYKCLSLSSTAVVLSLLVVCLASQETIEQVSMAFSL